MLTVDPPALEIDLTEIEATVGPTSFERGATYARKRRVQSLSWDVGSGMLSGRVVGMGETYDTAVFFRVDDADLEFQDGECSCPIGWNCKHVAALAITAADGSERRPSPTTGGRDVAAPTRWEQPLRAMLAGPALPATGSPLAIELVLTVPSAGSASGPPRLRARLMRPGARGGWINGSLRWSSLEGWDLRGEELREDHLDLARAFYAVHQAHAGPQRSYYGYGYGDRDGKIDLTDWDAGQLWPLLDRAARVGMVTIHGRGPLGDVPRHWRGELVLDVTSAADGAARVTPVLTLDGGEPSGFTPLTFLGANGHGMVLVGDAAENSRASGTPGAIGPLRLVRLARDTPPELQRLVLDHTQLQVPEGELRRFATELAPALRHVAPVQSSDHSFEVLEVSDPELVLRTAHGEGHAARVAWGWTYTVGEDSIDFDLPVNGSGPGFRDLDAERDILDRLRLAGTGLGDLGLLDAGGRPTAGAAQLTGLQTARLVTEALPALERDGAVRMQVRGEALDYRDRDGSVQIEVSTAEIAGERDWFDLDVTITVEEHELPFAQVFAAMARGETRMLLDDGVHFSLLAPELESLRALIEEARALRDGDQPGTLRLSRYQASLWQELVGLGVVRAQAEGWQRQVDGLLGLQELTDRDAPAALDAELRPYQREGFNWLATLWELGLGGILADDMGLGKTLQTLALICHARAEGETRPFMVVAPTSVVSNWVGEAERFAPGLTVRAVTDTLARAGVPITDVVAAADVIVTTYTLARLDADHYAAVEWAGVILDEAQAVKNHHSKTHAAVRRLPAPFKLAVTGTPLENNLTELWALLSITAPGLFPDPKAFDEQYARLIERHGDAERLARLRRRIRPLITRRTKERVAADLPAKQEQTLQVVLHPRHRKLYDTHLARERQRILGLLDDFDRNRFSVLTAITRLRQLSLHPGLADDGQRTIPAAKLEALSEHLQEMADGGHRALVFSQFTGFLAMVRERLDADGIGYVYLDGKTRRRDRVLARFKDGDDPVFLISLKAGGSGLNLVEADYCFLLDPWWNPAVENQAIDRTHRIGQTRSVMVYRLVSQNTIEEKVVALAQRKAALFGSVLDDGDLFSGQITAEDIRGLLG
jgi:superfamily II DNA or RNA helicase